MGIRNDYIGEIAKQFIEKNKREERNHREGRYTLYHENGVVKVECEYSQGKLNGEYRAYDKFGQLTEKGVAVSGIFIGFYEVFDRNIIYWFDMGKKHELLNFRDFDSNFEFEIDDQKFEIKYKDNKVVECKVSKFTANDRAFLMPHDFFNPEVNFKKTYHFSKCGKVFLTEYTHHTYEETTIMKNLMF